MNVMPGADNVIVAVRVRPFNDREKQRNAKLVIKMPNEQVTEIIDPNNNGEPKRFTFDHSYWSHDGFKADKHGYFSPANKKYADQKRVFDDLGKGVLDNAWKGYNCSLFAYGQTGSGKSYSIVGFKKNKGIVPMVCEELFRRIEEKRKESDIEYQVTIAMLEIYCERIRDLLSKTPPPKGGLKLRENPKTGFYVEGLSKSPVSSYKEIESKIDEGTKSRTIAATNMNATSSRAHTIVKIEFVQKLGKKGDEKATTKSSEINLVDLAGSERQKDAGSEGDRLKEGIVINQSLSTLGRVIKALHDKQTSKSKTIQIPYRDSVLTSLLKNALGGNSKTIMIAAISPADINYEETLSTLRFADRAKAIKTQAVVNESATERHMRELREENEKLQKMIKKGAVDGSAASQDELESLKRQLAENQKAMEDLEKTWQERLNEERKKHHGDDRAEINEKRKTQPHLWNLNEDPALTDMVVLFIPEGDNVVGNGNSGHNTSIVLKGLSIQPEHALIKNHNNKKFTIQPLRGSELLVNGKPVVGETSFSQNDRVMFGGNHLYVFVNPKKGGVKNSQEITYEMAQKEIAKNVGISGNLGGTGKNTAILEEDLVNLLPNVYRANAMAKELKRNVAFEIVLMAPEARGLRDGDTQVGLMTRVVIRLQILVRATNKADDTSFLWDQHKFMNRYYGMSEMYQNYIDNDPQWNLARDKDPFFESTDSSVDVGTATVFLRSLAYMVEQDEQYPITDIQGAEVGQLTLALTPCNSNGKEILGEFVEDPGELVGKNLGFKIKILTGLNLPRRVKESWCRYRFYDKEETQTHKAQGNNPAYGHEHLFMFKPVTRELVDYLKDQYLCVTVCGTQKAKETDKHTGEVVQRINDYLNEENHNKKKNKKPRASARSVERKRKKVDERPDERHHGKLAKDPINENKDPAKKLGMHHPVRRPSIQPHKNKLRKSPTPSRTSRAVSPKKRSTSTTPRSKAMPKKSPARTKPSPKRKPKPKRATSAT